MVVIVFDLDDTLYEEKTFVFSGFRAVSKMLERYGLPPLYQEFVEAFQQSREQVFDRVLKRHGLRKTLVKQCVSKYRSHKPAITLFPKAEACLQRLRHLPLYVVTDGNVRVQRSKCAALGLKKYVKKCLCTWQYGHSKAKPSPFAFEKICQWEQVKPNDLVYIADNPHKDFIGIKRLGVHTIRVRTGPYRDLFIDKEHEADQVVTDLSAVKSNA